MKKIILLFLAVVGIAAGVLAQKKTFMRLYDLSGHKFTKGYFGGTTDTSILLIKNDSAVTAVPVSQIGIIKTRRTVSHTIILTTIPFSLFIGLLAGGFVNALNTPPFHVTDAGKAKAGGYIIGAITGASIGAIARLSKNSPVFRINGKKEIWLQ